MTQIMEFLIELMMLILLWMIFQDMQKKSLTEQRIGYLEKQMEEAASIPLKLPTHDH
jgi:hypothetical protein